MPAETVVFGTVFMDCKGFAAYRYDPLGRNVGSVRFIHGGVGRNVAEDLASIGAKVSFVSSVDDSALGLEVLNRLKNEGIDVGHVRRAPSSGMGLWLAIMDQNGDLAASISQMPDLSIMDEIVRSEGESIVAGCKNVILELDLNDHISTTVLSLAKRYGKKVYGITGNMEVILRNRPMLGGLECYICNETEAGRLLEREIPTREPEAALALLRGYVDASGLKSMVITMGEQGSVYYDAVSAESGFCPSIPTKVTDSSGAGDAFFSGTVEALIRGFPLGQAVGYGTRLASWTIEVAEPTRTPLPGNLF